MSRIVSDGAAQLDASARAAVAFTPTGGAAVSTGPLEAMLLVASTLVARDGERLLREGPKLSQLQLDPRVDEGLRQKAMEISQLDAETDSPLAAPPTKDGTFVLRTSEDLMTASIDIEPPVGSGDAVAAANVRDALQARGIQRGLLPEAINDALAKASRGSPVHKHLIARGRLAQSTTHERLLFHLRKAPSEEPVTVEGFQGFATVSCWYCRQDDVIAEICPGQRGKNGYDITGRELPAEEIKDVRVAAGLNVRTEGTRFIATTSGLAWFGHGQLEVRELLVLRKDITRADGVVEFDGEVLIRGAVRDGVRIIATGNITIHGLVEAAEVVSREGSIFLAHGITGRHRGRIVAGDSIIARFAENTTLRAENDITIEKAAVHSQLIAGRKIICVRDRGQIMGGMALAGKSIEVRCAGGQLGVATELAVGLSRECMHSLGRIERVLQAYRLQREEVDQAVDKIRRAVGDPRKLPAAQRRIFALLLRKQLRMSLRMQRLNERRFNLHRNAGSGTGEIIVRKEVMDRVNIRVGNCALKNTEVLGPSRFTCAAGKDGIERRDL